MRPLLVDFARPLRRARIASAPLLIAVAVATGSLALWRMQLQSEVALLDSQLNKLATGAGVFAQDTPPDAAVEQQIRQANEVIEQIALPWDRLFRAVEGAATADVTLLAIAPDVRTGNVQLRAETAEAEAMFAYAKRLAEQPELKRVMLVEHRTEAGELARPLQFVVTASWMEQDR